jgi:hypothetical protein
MATTITTVADIVNLALTRIGYRLRISNLYDGSEASQAALNIYGQTRDDLMRDGEWQFCQRNVVATLLRSAPVGGYWPGGSAWDAATNPPLPWLYAYAYPGDCLKVRVLKPSTGFLVNMTPLPNQYTITNVLDTVSTLATLAVNSPGTSGYVPGDFIYPTGGTQTAQPVLQAMATKVVTATIAAAGTGGTPGSQTVTGTTGTGTKFTATVTISGAGAISSVDAISTGGVYTVNPTTLTAEPVTGASLSGAQLSVSMGIQSISIVYAGVFTATSTTFTQGSTSGSGAGATFNTATFTTTTKSRRVIACNVTDAMLTYAGQVTDPTQWPPDFTEALAAALGRRLVPVLVGMNALQSAAQDEAVANAAAQGEQG